MLEPGLDGGPNRWIIKKDLEDMKRLGLNVVRIPIGCQSPPPLPLPVLVRS